MSLTILYAQEEKRGIGQYNSITISRWTYDQTVDTIATLSDHEDERRGTLGLT